MTHLASAIQSENDFSFKVALKDRDSEHNSRYLDGVCEGRRLQQEYDQGYLDDVQIFRVERDEALEAASKHFVELCAVQDELQQVKEQLRALQELFEDVTDLDAKKSSFWNSQSLSYDDIYFPEEFYDPHTMSPEISNGGQLPTPPGSPGSPSPPLCTVESDSQPSGIDYFDEPPSTIPVHPLQDGRSPPPPSDGGVLQTNPALLQDPAPALDSIEKLQSLMQNACTGDERALVEIKALCTLAHRTPQRERTDLQRFILTNWRGLPPLSPPLNPSELTGQFSDKKTVSHAGHEIYVDSSSWGIGFIMGDRWLAWKLKDGWKVKERDNNWGEMVAVELGLRVLIAAGHHSRTITVRSDNTGVVRSLVTGISKNYQQNVILQKILQLCDTYQIKITPKWIPTKDNPADKPSRGVFPSRALLFPNPPPLPSHLTNFIHPSVEFRSVPS